MPVKLPKIDTPDALLADNRTAYLRGFCFTYTPRVLVRHAYLQGLKDARGATAKQRDELHTLLVEISDAAFTAHLMGRSSSNAAGNRDVHWPIWAAGLSQTGVLMQIDERLRSYMDGTKEG